MAVQTTEKHWYAIFTKTGAERQVVDGILQLNEQYLVGCEIYLPLVTEARANKGKKSPRETPLFKNYLFVKHDQNAFSKIKFVRGVSSYVSSGSVPIAIPEEQIQSIKKISQSSIVDVKSSSQQPAGKKVEVVKGMFTGHFGTLLQGINEQLLVIEIDSLKLCVTVELSMTDVISETA